MLKTFNYSNYDGLRIKHSADIAFKELSSGVYHVEKDRYNDVPEFVSHGGVVRQIRGVRKVLVIKSNSKEAYANFDAVEYMNEFDRYGYSNW